jgi:hypothetical protein
VELAALRKAPRHPHSRENRGKAGHTEAIAHAITVEHRCVPPPEIDPRRIVSEGQICAARRLTVRDMALMHGRSVGLPQIVGTPEQVADQLEAYFERAGGDGFMLTAAYTPARWRTSWTSWSRSSRGAGASARSTPAPRSATTCASTTDGPRPLPKTDGGASPHFGPQPRRRG